MSLPIRIGHEVDSDNAVHIDPIALALHAWIIGLTGSGKSELIKSILIQRLMDASSSPAVFVIDPLGGLSKDFLNFFAHPTLSPDSLRDRLVYIELARGDKILTMNPLEHESADDLFFNTGQAVEVMLRGSASQDLSSQPRLRQWMFNAFLSTAAMNYPPAMAEFLLRPGTEQHVQMLRQIPERLRLVWAEILKTGSSVKMQLLESTRNRTASFFDCPILRLMFSHRVGKFDVQEMIRERKFVLINLAPQGVITEDIASTVGGLFVNRILSAIRNMPVEQVKPTILCLDECQRWIGQDLLNAIPEVRQRGAELILSHQSISQLKRGDIDMTSILHQCRNKIVFCNSGEDADLLANEFAAMDFDPMRLKEELKSFRQKKVGQHKEILRSYGTTETVSDASDISSGKTTSSNRSTTKPNSGDGGSEQTGQSESESQSNSRKSARSSGSSESFSETLVDDIEDFYEVNSRTYYTFQEQFQEWAKRVRKLKTGQMVCIFKDDPKLYHVMGEMIEILETPTLLKLKEELIERNFKQKYFISREEAEASLNEMIENLRLGRTPQIIDAESKRIEKNDDSDSEDENNDVFR